MSRKRRRKRGKRSRRSRKPAAAAGGIHLTTPEGDEIVLTSARYRHSALEDVYSILQQADDFGLEDDLEAEPDDSFHFPWYETRPGASKPFPSIGNRVLAQLTLTPTTLEVEAPSRRRLDDCRQRLEQLLGDRIRLLETKSKSVEQALREKPPAEREEPFIPPPELVAEIEEKILRQWIDDSIPALGGLTPREAVKTPEGRQQVLELIEHSVQMQNRMPQTPGMFTPDYRKVKKMLGLE
jgi:hypothetical protein